MGKEIRAANTTGELGLGLELANASIVTNDGGLFNHVVHVNDAD